MIQLKQVTLRRGIKTLLEDANLLIHTGDKVGFVGLNGTGKSSLFELLRGELESDSGEVSFAKQVVMAQIRQEIPTGDQSIIDYVLLGDAQLAEIKQQIIRAEQHNNGTHLATLYQCYADLEGYSAESRAAKLLIGLGFSQEQLQSPIDDFSGGWRMRLNLARLLIAPADVLLLDEPTNHLDLEAIIWLEQWLHDLPQTLLIISHDREFLDNVVNQIVHFDNTQLKSYTGNYSRFEKQYADNLVIQAKTYANQQQKIAHLQHYVDRFRAKATKAKQAQSRLKMIERMERVAPVHIASPFYFTFKQSPNVSNPMLRIDKVNIGYDDRTILTDVSLSLYSGDRIALLGPNGSGKSTFIKVLADKLVAKGKVVRSNKVVVGYFTQHQVENLRLNESALWHLKNLDAMIQEKEARSYLGGFNFQGDRVFEPVSNFSGGEKARLALALLVWQQPNLLLLDEPSNHLDLEMREALSQALLSYDGALVLITHDRYLIKTLVNDLYLVANGTVQPFDNDVDGYQNWLLAESQKALAEQAPMVKKTKAVPRKKIINLQPKLDRLEQQHQQLVQQLSELEHQIAQHYVGCGQPTDDVLQKRENILHEINALEEKMLGLMEQME